MSGHRNFKNIQRRKMINDERTEMEAILNTYKSAWGLA